jgi:hypothetical protein
MKNSTPKNDKFSDNKPLGWKRKQHCADYVISTLKGANHALNYVDFGGIYHYGTLRNTMSLLAKSAIVLVLPKECPGRFILPSWATRPEYAWSIRNDKKSRMGKCDFLSYLEGIGWGDKLCIHNLKFTFQAYQYHWINKEGNEWKYCKSNQSWNRILNLTYPVRIQCFDTGTVMVSVKCTNRPFPLDLNGLGALQSLLGEVRNALHTPCIPDPADWLVAQWHLNRDSEKLQGGGLDVYLTFRDFFGDSAQFYHKHALDRMRAEVNQSPKQTMKQLFESILNRDSLPVGSGESD